VWENGAMRRTAGLCAAAVLAVVAASAWGMQMCEYRGTTVCDEAATKVCYEGAKNECIDTTTGGDASSVLVFCTADGFDFNKFNTNDCTGPTTGISVVGTEDSCTSNGDNSYKFSGCSTDCFPADALVETRLGARKRMDEIAIGDEVRVARELFSEVYFWGHKDAETVSRNYVRIALESGRALTISRNHLVYANGKLLRADEVAVGDLLVDADVGASAVVQIETGVAKKGLYNPHTVHGDIVVDGVIASTYTSVQLSALSHTLLAVERFAYRLGFSVLGNMLETKRPALLSIALELTPHSN